jgi:predicted nucleic acid-binding protein
LGGGTQRFCTPSAGWKFVCAAKFDLIVQKVREDFENEYRVIDVDQTLIETATELVMQHPLRAYDSVQLASALRFQSTTLLSQCQKLN